MKSILALHCVFLIVVLAAASPPLPQPGDSESHLSPNCRTPKCPDVKGDEQRTVNLPYPLDCLQYVSCKGTQAQVLPCPPDTVFDKNTSVCSPQSRVQCVPCYQMTG